MTDATLAPGIKEDGWLSSVLGVPTFKVDPAGACAALPSAVASREPGFYYARVPTHDVATLRELTLLGMYVVDVNVTLARDPGDRPAAPPQVDGLREGDDAEIVAIAGRAFRFSRFHLDTRIPRAVADRVKSEWVANYVRRHRGDRLFVARHDGRPAGFLAAMTGELDGSPSATIDLVAVDPPKQGLGLGRALLDAFVAYYAPTHPHLRVGTQVANAHSIAFYERAGFRMVDSSYVLHMHLPRGGSQ